MLAGDASLLALLDGKWQNVVTKKLYLTGGIGLPAGEAFGRDYDLPNATAYQRNVRGDRQHPLELPHVPGSWTTAKYLDVLERTALQRLSLAAWASSGDRFFYPNPLACAASSHYRRVPWFGCPCCPTNVVRFLPQIAGYFYAIRGDEVYVNLFVGGEARMTVAGSR